MKKFLLPLLCLGCITAANAQGPGLIISEALINPAGTDSPFEYVELVATKNINFATTPYCVIVCNNGTATASGWVSGGVLSYGFNINTGSVSRGDVVYVGGTSMAPTGVKIRAINTGTTGGDGFGTAAAAGVFGNGGANADGIAVFNVAIGSVTNSTVPVDAVFYGTGIGSAFVSTTTGYQLPVNDLYSGGKLQTSSFVALDPGGSNLVASGTFDTTTHTFSTPRTFSTGSLTDGTSSVVLGPVADIVPPTYTLAKATGFNQVYAVFNERVKYATAINPAHYSATPAISISSITLSATRDTAFLNLSSPLTNGTTYTLTVSSVADSAGNVMPSPQSHNFFFEHIYMNHYEWKTPPYLGSYMGQNIYNGGFSGLHFIPGTNLEFYTITDRGPNLDANANVHAIAMGGPNNTGKLFPLPSFNPQFLRMKASGDSLIFMSSMPVRRPDNSPTSGLTNPTTAGGTGEIALADTAGTLTPTDVWGIDSEALTAGNDNDYWISEEYGVSVWHVDANAKVINRYAPYGDTPAGQPEDIAIDTIFKYRNPNKGFEGLVFSPNGKVYAFLQNTLLFPVSDVNLKKNTRLHRFIEIDPLTNATRMLGYQHDKWNSTGPLSTIKNDKRYVGDAVAINDHEFLVLEHGFSSSESYAKVYKIDVNTATPINPTNHLAYGGNSFEQLLDSTTAASYGVTVVKKTLFLDLIAAGYPGNIEKEEGITIVNDTTIAIANDNDFGLVSPASDGVVAPNGVKSYIYTFSVPQYKKLNLCLPVSITPSGITTFCEGGSVTLTTPTVTGATYAWTYNGTPIMGATTNTITTDSSGVYGATVTNMSGCTAVAGNKTITVNPLPAVVANATDNDVCMGENTTLTGSGADVYGWDNSVTDGVAFTPASTITYTVTGTITATGCTNTDMITVTVNPLPTVTANATANVLCQGESTTLTGSGTDAYSWTGSVTDGVAFTPASTATYTVTGTDMTTGCTNTDMITVTVNPLPSPVVAFDGSDLYLTASFSTYQWNLGGSPITGANASTYSPVANGNYTVTVTDANGCQNTSPAYNLTTLAVSGITNNNNGYNVYPNPFDQTLKITVPAGEQVSVVVMNAMGQKVFEKNNYSGESLDLAHLVNGLYTVIVKGTHNQANFQVVKN